MNKYKSNTAEENIPSRAVTYIGENGEKQTGTIPAVPGSGTAGEWYAAQLEQAKMNNAAQAEDTAARARAEADKQVNALRDQYAAANRQLYRDYMEDKKALPQAMAAQGYTGGLSESGRLKLETSYGEELNENERARLQQENEIRTAQNQQLRTAEAAAGSADSKALEDYYGHMAALAQKEYETSLANAQTRAKKLADSGDISGLLALGYTEEEAKYLVRLWLQDNDEHARLWADTFAGDNARYGIL